MLMWGLYVSKCSLILIIYNAWSAWSCKNLDTVCKDPWMYVILHSHVRFCMVPLDRRRRPPFVSSYELNYLAQAAAQVDKQCVPWS